MAILVPPTWTFEDDFESYAAGSTFPQGIWEGDFNDVYGCTVEDGYFPTRAIFKDGGTQGVGSVARATYSSYVGQAATIEVQVEYGGGSNNQPHLDARSLLDGSPTDGLITFRASNYQFAPGIRVYEQFEGSVVLRAQGAYTLTVGGTYTLRAAVEGLTYVFELWDEAATTLLQSISGSNLGGTTSGYFGFGRDAAGDGIYSAFDNFKILNSVLVPPDGVITSDLNALGQSATGESSNPPTELPPVPSPRFHLGKRLKGTGRWAAVPMPTQDVKSLQESAVALKDRSSVQSRETGDLLDSFVTVRDLIALGLVDPD